jgi:hypothetical protein
VTGSNTNEVGTEFLIHDARVTAETLRLTIPFGIHWPDIDEDLSAAGMVNDVPARRPGKAKPKGQL